MVQRLRTAHNTRSRRRLHGRLFAMRKHEADRMNVKAVHDHRAGNMFIVPGGKRTIQAEIVGEYCNHFYDLDIWQPGQDKPPQRKLDDFE